MHQFLIPGREIEPSSRSIMLFVCGLDSSPPMSQVAFRLGKVLCLGFWIRQTYPAEFSGWIVLLPFLWRWVKLWLGLLQCFRSANIQVLDFAFPFPLLYHNVNPSDSPAIPVEKNWSGDSQEVIHNARVTGCPSWALFPLVKLQPQERLLNVGLPLHKERANVVSM